MIVDETVIIADMDKKGGYIIHNKHPGQGVPCILMVCNAPVGTEKLYLWWQEIDITLNNPEDLMAGLARVKQDNKKENDK